MRMVQLLKDYDFSDSDCSQLLEIIIAYNRDYDFVMDAVSKLDNCIEKRARKSYLSKVLRAGLSAPRIKTNSFNDFGQRKDYDFEKIEKMILAN